MSTWNITLVYLIMLLTLGQLFSCTKSSLNHNSLITRQDEIELIVPIEITTTVEIPAEYETTTEMVLDSITGKKHTVTKMISDYPVRTRTVTRTIDKFKVELKYPDKLVPLNPSHLVTITLYNQDNHLDTIECKLWDSSENVTISNEEFSSSQTILNENTWVWKVFLPNRKLEFVEFCYKISGMNIEDSRKTFKVKVQQLTYLQKFWQKFTITNTILLATVFAIIWGFIKKQVSVKSIFDYLIKDIRNNNGKEK